jgi:O-antigen ligase
LSNTLVHLKTFLSGAKLNISVNQLLALVLLLIYGFSFIVWSYLPYPNNVEINAITILSLFFFISISTLSLASIKTFIFLLPVAALITPNAINDIFPGVLISGLYDSNQVKFSILTHIDILLILGLVRFKTKLYNGHIFIISNWIKITVISYCFALPFIYTLDEEPSITAGFFQLRYAILLILIAERIDFLKHYQLFILGCVVATLGIVLESTVFTYLANGDRLSSGNYATNGLGHILGAFTLFFYYGSINIKNNFIRAAVKFGMPTIAMVAVYLTGTRGALISVAISSALIFISNGRRSFISKFLFSFVISIVFFLIHKSQVFNDIYPVITEIINSDFDISSLKKSEDTSSILSRYAIWEGTLKMINENPFLGVGPGVWNSIKNNYGINYFVLLDPHNEYLSAISSYGIFYGFFFLYLIFVVPLIRGFKQILFSSTTDYSVSVTTLGFVLSLAISGLSNANLAKHQIYFITLVIVLCFYIQCNHSRACQRHMNFCKFSI